MKTLVAGLFIALTIIASTGMPQVKPRPVPNSRTVHLEKAVLSGLRWLKSQQAADGSWGTEPHNVEETALGLWAFLSHGETGDSEEFGNTITRAAQWLESRISSNGTIWGVDLAGHALVLKVELARLDMNGQTNLPLHAKLLADFAASQQQVSGGWPTRSGGTNMDSIATVWMLSSLKPTETSPSGLPKIRCWEAMQRLWETYSEPGFSVDGRNVSVPATALLTCYLSASNFENPYLKRSFAFLRDELQRNLLDTSSMEVACFATHALFQGGGDFWVKSHKRLLEWVLQSQRPDGSWLTARKHPVDAGIFSETPVAETAWAILGVSVYYAWYRYDWFSVGGCR